MKKCKYCSNYFKGQSWHTEEGKDTCFSCRFMKDTLSAFCLSLNPIKPFSKKSREYWQNKIKSILTPLPNQTNDKE